MGNSLSKKPIRAQSEYGKIKKYYCGFLKPDIKVDYMGIKKVTSL